MWKRRLFLFKNRSTKKEEFRTLLLDFQKQLELLAAICDFQDNDSDSDEFDTL